MNYVSQVRSDIRGGGDATRFADRREVMQQDSLTGWRLYIGTGEASTSIITEQYQAYMACMIKRGMPSEKGWVFRNIKQHVCLVVIM